MDQEALLGFHSAVRLDSKETPILESVSLLEVYIVTLQTNISW